MVSIGLECRVGGCIERVFYMNTESGILFKVGVGKQGCPSALGITSFQFVDIAFSHCRHAHARIEQEEMIISIV